jgi:hypothetical protein
VAAKLCDHVDVGLLSRGRHIADRQCPRSCADEEGLPRPSGAPVLSRKGVTIHILSSRNLSSVILR